MFKYIDIIVSDFVYMLLLVFSPDLLYVRLCCEGRTFVGVDPALVFASYIMSYLLCVEWILDMNKIIKILLQCKGKKGKGSV